MRPAWSRLAGVFAVLLTSVSGCATGPVEPPRDGIAGLTITYRFEIGRVYRASYGADTVRFELLEPATSPPVSETLPYRAQRLRDGLFLVVWDDPAFHTTFVIDLARGRLHASALRGEQGSFLGVARILSASFEEPPG